MTKEKYDNIIEGIHKEINELSNEAKIHLISDIVEPLQCALWEIEMMDVRIRKYYSELLEKEARNATLTDLGITARKIRLFYLELSNEMAKMGL